MNGKQSYRVYLASSDGLSALEERIGWDFYKSSKDLEWQNDGLYEDKPARSFRRLMEGLF